MDGFCPKHLTSLLYQFTFTEPACSKTHKRTFSNRTHFIKKRGQNDPPPHYNEICEAEEKYIRC